MLNNRLAWRMGALYLRRQLRQTLLSMLAGSIGAMLIMVSFFHYGSVRTSGDEWVSSYFGPVDWALVPAQADVFTKEATAQLTAPAAAAMMRYRYLPVTGNTVTLYTSSEPDADKVSLPQAQMLGFDAGAAANFDPASSVLWSSPLKRGEALLDQEAAARLGLKPGDAVYIPDQTGGRRGFVVRDTPVPSGLTGFRGDGASLSATLILHPDDARLLTGVGEDDANLILAARINPEDSVMGMSLPGGTKHLFTIRFIKMNALNMANSELVVIILIISLTAVFSSAFLLRQIVLMMADSRRELYGVLRAVGLQRRQVRSLFRAEALLLGLLSGAVGITAGLGGGYVLVKLVYGTQQANQLAATGIPVKPGLSLPVLAAGIAIVLAYQLLLVLLASRRAGAGSIVAALRGGSREASVPGRKKGIAAAAWMVLTFSCMTLVALHLYQAFAWKPKTAGSQEVLTLVAVWLLSGVSLVLLMQGILAGAGKLFGAKTGPSALLSLKYAQQRPGRSFTVMLLFAVAMMTLTFTSGLSGLILGNMDPKQGVQTVLGYDGFVPYKSLAERDAVLKLLKQDDFLLRSVTGHTDVKPVMAAPQVAPGGGRMTHAFLAVTEELATKGQWRLSARSPEFADDRQAWQKVMSDPGYIVLPNVYRDYGTPQSDLFWRPDKLYRPGDKIEMSFFRNDLIQQGSLPDVTLSFTIAGFAESNTEESVHVQYVYSTAYVHPEIGDLLMDSYQSRIGQDYAGLLLLKLDHENLEQDERIVNRLVSGGAGKAVIPYLESWREHQANKRLIHGFIIFTGLSAAIGLLGLAVLQTRSIHERQREIAMLRCAGVPSQLLWRAFLLEGSLLGGLGLLAGWGLGLTGAHAFTRLLQTDLRPWEQPVQVTFDWVFLTSVIILLMVLTVLFQLSPARTALGGSPAETLRRADV
ncbi:MAG: transporter permease [Paenibacillaceae bacterium]|jgi:ABC-type lipoprotein release transport system permease subunit|nr:transporter permease [Paenibacillaceae bacterium]